MRNIKKVTNVSKRLNNVSGETELRNFNELSTRALNALHGQGVFTIGELHHFLKIKNIDYIRNVGKLTSREIRNFAAKFRRIDNKYYFKNIEEDKNNIEQINDDLKNLSTRSKNILKRLNISTIDELLKFLKNNNIEDIRGVGRLTVNEINNVIKRHIKDSDSISKNQLMFEHINNNNKKLSIDTLIIAKVAPPAINKLKKINIRNFDDFNKVHKIDIASMVSKLSLSRIEKMGKLLTKSPFDVFEIVLTNDMSEKDFEIYLRRAQGSTLQEIADNPVGDEEKVTRERIRQIEKKYYSKIFQLVKHIALIMMRSRGFITIDDISEKYLKNEFVQIFIHTCKRISGFEYFDFADTFIVKTNKITEERLAKLIESYTGEGINLYEKMVDLEEYLHSEGYKFIDLSNIINFFNKYNYTVLGEFVFKKSPPYGFLCSNIVKQNFPDGIKLNQNDESPEQDLKILRKIVKEKYGGVKLPESDRALSARISDYLVLSKRGMVTHPDNIFVDITLLDNIKKYIDSNVNNKLYYVEIFSEFEGILTLTSNIDNHNFLHGVLQYYYPQSYNYSRDYLIKHGMDIEEEASISDRINDFIIKTGRYVTKIELERKFAGFSDAILYMSILNDKRLIQWGYNQYNSMNLIKYNDYDINMLENILNEVMLENNGYSSDLYFYKRVKSKYLHFLKKNNIVSEMNLFYIVENLLRAKYDFRRPHIAVKDKYRVLSAKEIVLSILGYPDTISYYKFMKLSNRLMWASVTSSMVFKEIERDYIRISFDEYLLQDKFTMDQEKINEITKLIYHNLSFDILPIMSIDDYCKFPNLTYEWNDFLFGSIVENICKDFVLVQPSVQDRRYQRGIITHKKSGLNSYSEIVANMMIAQNYESLSESKMLSFLIVNNLTKNSIPKELNSSEFIKYVDGKYFLKV